MHPGGRSYCSVGRSLGEVPRKLGKIGNFYVVDRQILPKGKAAAGDSAAEKDPVWPTTAKTLTSYPLKR
jgi:hypothetical protein